MAVFICQGCGAEHATWAGTCPHCGNHETIRLQAGDKMIDKVIKGRFKIVKKLGQGGMGAVYLAEQVGIGHKVALKFLKSEFSTDAEIARRFLNEAKSYARVAHPNAVALHDFGQDDEGNLYIAMEYCEGTDLKKVIAEAGRLPVVEAVEIVLQVADVLANAHEKGVIHRDLKPENIMIRRGLRGVHAKVLDFGIARLMDAGTRLTVEGSIAGTPRYMSPEQVEGKQVDLRADIYSLGVVLFEALTGVQPFDGATIAEILRKQVFQQVPKLSVVSIELDYPALDEVIQRATAKKRDERWPDLVAFASALSQAVPTQAHLQVPPLQRSALTPLHGVSPATPFPGSAGLATQGGASDPEAEAGTLLRLGTESGAAPMVLNGRVGAKTVPLEASTETLMGQPARPAGAVTRAGAETVTGEQQAWAGTRPGTATAVAPGGPAPRASRAPLVAGIVGGLAALAVGSWFALAPKPPPPAKPEPAAVKIEPQKPAPANPAPGAEGSTPPPAGGALAADDLKKVLREESARSSLSQGRTEFEVARLEAAETYLKAVEEGTAAYPEAKGLLGKIDAIREAMKKAASLRAQGRCDAATALYQKALDLNPRLEDARAGKAWCAQAAVSPTME